MSTSFNNHVVKGFEDRFDRNSKQAATLKISAC